MKTAYIGIGSNIEPEKNIAHALDLLSSLNITKTSTTYETKPYGYCSQDNFLNLVIQIQTELSAQELLFKLQEIEEKLHRERTIKNGPRTIDLDLLLFSDEIINTPTLSIPHPDMTNRDFVLIPLLEIAPELVDPQTKRPFSTFLAKITSPTVDKHL